MSSPKRKPCKADQVRNPITGRCIKKGGATYEKLLSKGVITGRSKTSRYPHIKDFLKNWQCPLPSFMKIDWDAWVASTVHLVKNPDEGSWANWEELAYYTGPWTSTCASRFQEGNPSDFHDYIAKVIDLFGRKFADAVEADMNIEYSE